MPRRRLADLIRGTLEQESVEVGRETLFKLADKPLILASRSPRRVSLLRRLGIPFETYPSRVEEPTPAGRPPEQLAIEVARHKAHDVAPRFPDRLVLGADTMVCLDDRILGKPHDRTEARSMLDALCGRWHMVVTGLCIVAAGRPEWSAIERTRVRMADFSDDELERYLATGEPYDKAGGYAIQGEAARLVEEIDGDYFNVVGLPLALFLEGLSRYAAVDGIVIPRPPDRFGWQGGNR